MTTSSKSEQGFVWHPVLFAAYPVLYLFSSNLGEVRPFDAILVLVVVSALTAAATYLLGKVFKRFDKTALIASLIIGFCFGYGAIANSFKNWFELSQKGMHLSALSIEAILIIIISLTIIRTSKKLTSLTSFCGLFAIVLVSLSAFQIGTYYFQFWQSLSSSESSGVIHLSESLPELSKTEFADRDRPDIYYLVFDRYASNANLKKYYQYDNRSFSTSLSKAGFNVSDNSYANYPKTAQSLASSLNIGYLDHLLSHPLAKSKSLRLLHNIIEDNEVSRFLRSQGYKFYHFGTWWQGTQSNRFADRNVNFSFLNEFCMALYDTTFLYPIVSTLFNFDSRTEQWKRVQHKFKELERLPDDENPKFVFAHFTIPHPPYVFHLDGSYKSRGERNQFSNKKNYIDQVYYVNRKILNLVKVLLKDSNRKPVIILQADEGPFPVRYQKNERDFDWRGATLDEIKEKVGILNAYYFPEQEGQNNLQEISPVNYFRVIFNRYFGSNLPLLPVRNYILRNDRFPYEFIDVTERLAVP